MSMTKEFSTVKKILADNNFSDFEWVYCRPTIADLFKPDKRCGIYVLHFRNNEFYVGQAVDLIRRFVQHTKTHQDIQEIAFKNITAKDLNELEELIIRTFEQKKIKLRNINLTSLPKGESDLDLLIPKIEQDRWLSNEAINKLGEHLISQPEQQERYAKKFRRLIKLKYFASDILPFLQEYFSKCIIQPARTELSFWCITVLPSGSKSYFRAINRVNLFWCEVLTIGIERENKNINYSFHITKDGITKNYLKELCKDIPTLKSDDHYYSKGGFDQLHIWVDNSDDAMKLLENKKILIAIKTFNLRQMQKGATVYSKYHCIDLAKTILTDTTSYDSCGSC